MPIATRKTPKMWYCHKCYSYKRRRDLFSEINGRNPLRCRQCHNMEPMLQRVLLRPTAKRTP